MQIPDGQRLLLAWLDEAGELQQILKRNPGIRRIYLIAPAPAGALSEHPAVRVVPLSQRQELPTLFAADQPFFSEGRVNLYFGAKKMEQQYTVCRELQSILLQFTQRHLSGMALRATRGWHILANELCNLPLLQHSLSQLSNVWKNDPVVLVGAGPSLDDTVAAIKQYRDHIRLIACDGAWNTLIQQGILPDLVVTTDDSHKVWRYFEVPDEQACVPVVALLQSCCHVARHHKGPVYFARNGRTRDQLLSTEFGLPLPALDAGLCCGHAALAIAQQMGAGQILLTGFDLGFKNGRFHPVDQPQPYYHDEPPPTENRLQAEANDGGTIETELSMQFYRQEFERRAAGLQPPIINATAGGARIAGTQYQSLDATLAPLAPLSKKPFCTQTLPPFPAAGPVLARMAREALDASSPQTLLHALQNRQSMHWQFISEAVNPALSTGVTLLLEDVQQQILGAEEDLKEYLHQLHETRQQLLEIVHTLSRITWPRKPTRRAFAFVHRHETAETAARAAGVEVIPQTLDPDNLPALWQAVEQQEIDTLIMENGRVLPAAWSLPGLHCLNVTTHPDAPPLQAEHRVPGFQELCVV